MITRGIERVEICDLTEGIGPIIRETLQTLCLQRGQSTHTTVGVRNIVPGPVRPGVSCRLCIETVGKLLYDSSLRISNADRKGGNRFLPIRSALLRIPVAAFGLKKYLSGTGWSSKRSDNEDSCPALGDAEVSTVKNSPRNAIPEVGQRPKDDCEVSATVGRKERRNVFEDDKLGATLSNELSKVVEESGLTSSETFARPHAGEADVLAWETSRPDFGVGDVICVNLLNIGVPNNVRPVLLKDVQAELLCLLYTSRCV